MGDYVHIIIQGSARIGSNLIACFLFITAFMEIHPSVAGMTKLVCCWIDPPGAGDKKETHIQNQVFILTKDLAASWCMCSNPLE